MTSTIATVLDQYGERLRRVNRTESTQTTYKTVVRSVLRWLRENDVQELTPWLLEEYLDTKTAPATRKLHLTFIRAAYRYALKRGMELEDPTEHLEMPTLEDKIPRIISIEELRAMKNDLMFSQDVLLFYLLAYTGMRRNEIRELQWEHIDLAHGTITVVGKGRKLRSVPIHPALGEELLDANSRSTGHVLFPRYREGEKISQPALWKRINLLTSGRHGAHDFRRTVATSLYINNVPSPVIDRVMGWATHGIGEKRYLHVAGPNLHAAILRLYADQPL